MKQTTMTLEELRAVRKYLRMRECDYQEAIEACKQSVLKDPTDKNLQYQFMLVGQYEIQLSHIAAVDSELRFDIEELTDEEEPYIAG